MLRRKPKEQVMSFEEFFKANSEIRKDNQQARVISVVMTVEGAVALSYGLPKFLAASFGLVAGGTTIPLVITVGGIVLVIYGLSKIQKTTYKIDASYEADRFIIENGIPINIETKEDIEKYVDTIAFENEGKARVLTNSIRRAQI